MYNGNICLFMSLIKYTFYLLVAILYLIDTLAHSKYNTLMLMEDQ